MTEYTDNNTYYEGGCELDIHNYIDYKEISIPSYEFNVFIELVLYTMEIHLRIQKTFYFTGDYFKYDFDISFAFKEMDH